MHIRTHLDTEDCKNRPEWILQLKKSTHFGRHICTNQHNVSNPPGTVLPGTVMIQAIIPGPSSPRPLLEILLLHHKYVHCNHQSYVEDKI